MTDAEELLRRIQREAPRVTSPPPKSRARLWLAVTGLAGYTVAVLVATMWPTPLDQGYEAAIDRFLAILHRNGVPTWFGYHKLEFLANVGMFVPLGFLLALAMPRRALWAVVLIIPAFSASIEFAQAVLLAQRFASALDVVANTAGGYVGAICAIGLRAVVDARDQRVVARALWEWEEG